MFYQAVSGYIESSHRIADIFQLIDCIEKNLRSINILDQLQDQRSKKSNYISHNKEKNYLKKSLCIK